MQLSILSLKTLGVRTAHHSHLCCFPLLLLLDLLTSSFSFVAFLVDLTVNWNIPNFREHTATSLRNHLVVTEEVHSNPPSLLCLSGTPPHIAHSSSPSSVSEQFLYSQSGQGLSLVLLWPSFLKNLNGSLFPTSFWYLKSVAFGSTQFYVSILLDTNISCVVIALRQYKEEQEDGFCNIGPIKLQKHNFKEGHQGSDSSLVTKVCITVILCGDHELTAW